MDEKEFPKLVQALYQTVGKLEEMFPGRHFTPDGHLVGSLGEALAKYYYGVELSTASAQGHDGIWGARRVEVKATQRDRIAISSEPEHLLVFKLLPDGRFEEHYNGPGPPVWEQLKGKIAPKRGQHQVALATLRRIMAEVEPGQVIEPCRSLPPGTRRNLCKQNISR
jgi:hypothetical protein